MPLPKVLARPDNMAFNSNAASLFAHHPARPLLGLQPKERKHAIRALRVESFKSGAMRLFAENILAFAPHATYARSCGEAYFRRAENLLNRYMLTGDETYLPRFTASVDRSIEHFQGPIEEAINANNAPVSSDYLGLARCYMLTPLQPEHRIKAKETLETAIAVAEEGPRKGIIRATAFSAFEEEGRTMLELADALKDDPLSKANRKQYLEMAATLYSLAADFADTERQAQALKDVADMCFTESGSPRLGALVSAKRPGDTPIGLQLATA